MGHTPKPLVQVWRAERGKWLYDCRRCHEQRHQPPRRRVLPKGVTRVR